MPSKTPVLVSSEETEIQAPTTGLGCLEQGAGPNRLVGHDLAIEKVANERRHFVELVFEREVPRV